MTSEPLTSALDCLGRSAPDAQRRLFELLRFPSISTDPAFDQACIDAAAWCVADLREIGFEARLVATTGKPMVVAHSPARKGKQRPHVLFYGHYDVQPPDPLELWTTPPFEPSLVEDPRHGRTIVARGASDDKGQFLTFFEACRAFLATSGELPVDVTILLEGEEESGSPSLTPFLKSHGEEIKADIALVCDTTMWDAETPAITAFLRGLVHAEMTVHGPSRDLHSGLFGGPALNPIVVLARLLAELHDEKGRITIPGFYDDVRLPSEQLRRQWAALGFDEGDFLAAIGLKTSAGEMDYSVLEQIWMRPTAEVNGIFGGYTGPGTKTVIPATATAKLSFRLVPEQEPAHIIEALHRFVSERLPADCKVTFAQEDGSPAVGFDTGTPLFRMAASALEQEWGAAPIVMGCGASIPIVEAFRTRLGMETILAGFALDDDCIHSPNEKYNLASFNKGARSWARILAAFGEEVKQ